jgi:hypothetical protein
MNQIIIKPYNVLTRSDLPDVNVKEIPSDGDPIEINGEMFFVCEKIIPDDSPFLQIGVIPLIVRDPSKIPNINQYIECLSQAHRRVQFRNRQGNCSLENCEEMIIS